MEDNQSLAAYITFRQLYNKNHTDHLSIIAEFIKRVIHSNKLRMFTIDDISTYLNDEFDFFIPTSIIKSAINKIGFVYRENNKYKVNGTCDLHAQSDIDKYYNEAYSLNKTIISKLSEYIQSNGGGTVEEKILLQSLYDFIINDNRNDSFYEYISAFFIQNAHDETVKEFMASIAEGYILFAGIHYNPDISSSVIWQKKITIYLEPEILIYLAGYNGELFKKLAKETLDFVKEMNNKGKDKIIKLSYFSDTKSEIEKLFFAAEKHLRDGRTVVELEETALQYLLSTSKEPADIINKKIEFYKLLESYGIYEAEEYNYYDEKNQEYNISDLSFFERSEDSIRNRYIEHLNRISILRKNNSAYDLKLSGYLILTETRKILELSREICKDSKKAPLAINMGMLTNRLWFDLSKGFGGQKIPSSFDIVVKSRIVLSRLLEQSISKQFRIERDRLDAGEVTKEELIEATVCYKAANKLPDEITSENTNEILSLITNDSIEEHRARLIKRSTEFKELKDSYIDAQSTNDSLSERNQRLEAVIKDDISTLESKLDTLQIQVREQRKTIRKTHKIIFWTSLIGYLLLLVFVLYLISVFYPLYKAFVGNETDLYEHFFQAIWVFGNIIIGIVDIKYKRKICTAYKKYRNFIVDKLFKRKLSSLKLQIAEVKRELAEKRNSLNSELSEKIS